jgi:hypothetical protein
MRRWDHQDSDAVPMHVDEVGVLWLQRLLVGRDAARRHGIGLDEHGPKGLQGLLLALTQTQILRSKHYTVAGINGVSKVEQRANLLQSLMNDGPMR